MESKAIIKIFDALEKQRRYELKRLQLEYGGEPKALLKERTYYLNGADLDAALLDFNNQRGEGHSEIRDNNGIK